MKYQIDPQLPERFQVTPNDERSEAEIAAWWDVPYIETWTAEKEEASTRKHQAWLNENSPGNAAADLESHVAEMVATFHSSCPSGTRYTVECLDGGAWDRPTWWGTFESLEEALECCENGPHRRRVKDVPVIVVGSYFILGSRLRHIVRCCGKDTVMTLNDMHAEVVRVNADDPHLPDPSPVELRDLPDDVVQLIRDNWDEKGDLKPEWIETIECVFESLMNDDDEGETPSPLRD